MMIGICSAVSVIILGLIVLVCMWEKLNEIRPARLTVAGWLLLLVTVAFTIGVSFTIGWRLSELLTYASGRRMWRTPLGLGAGLLALLLFAIGKAILTRLGIQIVRDKRDTNGPLK